VKRSLGDEDLAADVGDPREYAASHHTADRVLGDLKNLRALRHGVDGRLACAEAA
jgi:hypothetical protein